ncbi:MAG: hypothetical protein KDH97_20910, partial [Calditrichaeota bacterium]|nr:hypothetical protein [Calditrichota bacterium]
MMNGKNYESDLLILHETAEKKTNTWDGKMISRYNTSIYPTFLTIDARKPGYPKIFVNFLDYIKNTVYFCSNYRVIS